MSPITTLPGEIVDLICDELPLNDRSSLSMANRHMRQMALPSVLHSVTIHTHSASAAESVLLAATQYGHLIKEIRIVIPAAPCDAVSCDQCEERPRIKPKRRWSDPTGQQLEKRRLFKEKGCWSHTSGRLGLSLLRGNYDFLLPRLCHIAVEFPTRYGTHEYLSAADMFPMVGNGRVLDKSMEDKVWQWYSIETQSVSCVLAIFEALSKRGAAKSVRQFTMANLPMYDSRAGLSLTGFNSDGWRDFLGSVERFELSLWAGNEEAFTNDPGQTYWWQYSDPHKYDAFMEVLNVDIFDHLTSVKHLQFQGSLRTAIGRVDQHCGNRPLPFVGANTPANTTTMPLLESLKLVKVMIDEPLIDFLKSRVRLEPTLALTLENTWAYKAMCPCHPKDEDEPETWSVILNEMRRLVSRKDGLKLSSFEVVPGAVEGNTTPDSNLSAPFSPDTPPLRYATLVWVDDTEVREHAGVHLIEYWKRNSERLEKRAADKEAYHRLIKAVADSVKERRA